VRLHEDVIPESEIHFDVALRGARRFEVLSLVHDLLNRRCRTEIGLII
jgi:hypothetical protein